MVFLNSNNSHLKYDFQDFSIVPAIQTKIKSRKEIDILTKENNLPLIVAPMDTVINSDNYKKFLQERFICCLPRTSKLDLYLMRYTKSINVFYSLSLSQFEQLVNNLDKYIDECKILVDIANGHISYLVELIKEFKRKFPKAILMIGNVANPKTFSILSKAGADYIRVGIGGGQACTTSANVAIHYPMASLIKECVEEKVYNSINTKIIADGGFKNYDDIIKALALGADYVMLGSVLNKTTEACGQCYFLKIPISNKVCSFLFKIKKIKKFLTRKYRGMSTKEVQKTWNKQKLITSEGIVKKNKIEYTLSQWVENFSDYLRSAMSYSNAKDLKEFKEGTLGIFITPNSFKRFHK